MLNLMPRRAICGVWTEFFKEPAPSARIASATSKPPYIAPAASPPVTVSLSPSRSRRYPCGGSVAASTRRETESAGKALAGAEAAWISSTAKRSAAELVSNETVTEPARAEAVRHASASIIEKRISIRGIIEETGPRSMQNWRG